MLTESISISPARSSVSRKRAVNRLLFPAPVRPTTPTRSAGRVLKVTDRSDGAKLSLEGSRMSMSPEYSDDDMSILDLH